MRSIRAEINKFTHSSISTHGAIAGTNMQAVGRRISKRWKSVPPCSFSLPASSSNPIRWFRASNRCSLLRVEPPSPHSIRPIASQWKTNLNQSYATDASSSSSSSSSVVAPPCPLCLSSSSRLFAHQSRVRNRLVHRCDCCSLIFVSKKFHANDKEAKLRYDAHRNDLNECNSGYRSSLMQLVEPLARLIPGIGAIANASAGTRGLDFGCGPTLALSALLQQSIPHCRVDSYDPIYQPNDSLLASALTQPYDFIALNEVIEHMSDPALELTRLWGMLRRGGLMAIGTQQVSKQLEQAQLQYIQQRSQMQSVPEMSGLAKATTGVRKDKTKSKKLPLAPFEEWWYARDFTHITFYSQQTFSWIEQHWQPTTATTPNNGVAFPATAADGTSARWKSVFQSDNGWIAQKL